MARMIHDHDIPEIEQPMKYKLLGPDGPYRSEGGVQGVEGGAPWLIRLPPR